MNRGGTASLAAIALFLTLMLSWKMRKVAESSNQFWLTLSSVLSITAITLFPSQGFHDQVILLPCVFLVSLKWKELSPTWVAKALLLTATGVLLWPWFAAFALIVLRPLVTRPLFYSKTIFVLPLRTAAVFPFVLWGVLALGLRSLAALLTLTAAPFRRSGSRPIFGSDLARRLASGNRTVV